MVNSTTVNQSTHIAVFRKAALTQVYIRSHLRSKLKNVSHFPSIIIITPLIDSLYVLTDTYCEFLLFTKEIQIVFSNIIQLFFAYDAVLMNNTIMD